MTKDTDNDTDTDRIVPGKDSVTVVVSRRVYPGHEKEYDEWVRRLMEASKESPGSQGVTLLAPETGKTGLHHIMMRFADEKSMHIWETSYLRQKLSHEADAFSRRFMEGWYMGRDAGRQVYYSGARPWVFLL